MTRTQELKQLIRAFLRAHYSEWWNKLWLRLRFQISAIRFILQYPTPPIRRCRICGFEQSNPAYFAGDWAADNLCLECAGFKAVCIERDLMERDQRERRYSELMSAIADLEDEERLLEPSSQPQRGSNG